MVPALVPKYPNPPEHTPTAEGQFLAFRTRITLGRTPSKPQLDIRNSPRQPKELSGVLSTEI